ncbi:MAG: hypothetical protein NTY68_04385 [Candidatus Micrarchaeota archaeon]|nr:hypothetical protein [Candidatus Micrarchaeota archaeon]
MKAFIYSLDAFISLIIISMALNLLLFGLGASTYQYSVAYQLKLLSADGIKSIASSELTLSNILSNVPDTVYAECNSSIRQNLPPGYGYYLMKYDAKSNPPKWSVIDGCSEGDVSKAGIGVQSSDAVIVVSIPPTPPYTYKTCHGEYGLVPCNLQNFTMEWGMENTILRLVVFV